MNKVHRKVEYALMSIKYMASKRQGDLTSAKEISETYHASFEAVSRSLQILSQKGILKSEQGSQGGYLLARDLRKVSMLDLIEMMEGPTAIAKCLNSGESCEIHSVCNIISPIQNLNARLSEFYRGLSVQEVLRGATPEAAS